MFVEDDDALRKITAQAIREEGYFVQEASDGEEGFYSLINGYYDLIILDRMLPYIEGTELLRKARNQGTTTPVLFLTAKDQIGDRVAGLDAGADDYLTKPFDMRELFARIRALIRRPVDIAARTALGFGDLQFEPSTLALRGAKGDCILSKKEALLFDPLIRYNGETVPRTVLFASAWDPDSDVEEANLDTYAHFLRRRLANVSSSVTLTTVRGIGYRLVEAKHD